MVTSEASMPVLPFDVRFALEHRGAEIGTEEVVGVSTTMPNVGLYAAGKLLQASNELERMPRLLDAFMNGDPAEFAPAVEVAVGDIEGTAPMPKLAEHSRKLLGIEDGYRRAGLRSRGSSVFLLGPDTLVGVKPFGESLRERFGILFQPVEGQDSWMSIMVEPIRDSGFGISGLRAGLQGPNRGLVIADVYQSAAVAESVGAAYPRAGFETVQQG